MSFKVYFKICLKCFVNNITAPVIHPIETNIISCFIAGCGHSGTTLVTAKIGNHPEIYAIPRETNNFEPSKGLYTSKAITTEWLFFTEILGKSVFIEKTPKHVHSIKRIRKILPNSKFVLMIRNPLDNCASLFKRVGDFDYAIERWIIDNTELLNVKDFNNIKILKYENFTTYPFHETKAICSFLGISWHNNLLSRGKSIYDKIKQDGNMALRQKQVNQTIRQNIGTWKEILSYSQGHYVLKKTNELAIKLGYSKAYLQT